MKAKQADGSRGLEWEGVPCRTSGVSLKCTGSYVDDETVVCIESIFALERCIVGRFLTLQLAFGTEFSISSF